MAKDFRKIPPNRLRWYAGLDADVTLRVREEQRATFHPDFVRTWRSVMGPADWALGCMERWGALVSEANVRAYDAELEERAEDLRGRLAARGIREDFNPRSGDQLGDLIFGQLGLKQKGRAKKTATGKQSLAAEVIQGMVTDRWGVPFSLSTGLPDMDAEALAQKRAADDGLDVVLSVIELKDALNQRSKYGLGYLKHIGHDGRVHTTFKVARTLRLRSKDPNLQNLTSPDDELPPDQDPGVRARGIFVPPPEWVIISADYSQAELRWGAELSGDEVMAAAFEQAVDFHTVTAQKIFSVADVKDVSKGQRRIAKNCFHPDTEVLTRKGWKRIWDLAEGEEVVQAIPEAGPRARLEWVVPYAINRLPEPPGGARRLVHLYNEGLDLRLTPEHRTLGFTLGGNPKVYTPEEFAKAARSWLNAGMMTEPSAPPKVDQRLLRLAVAAQADGYVAAGRIRWGFTKARKIARMERLLGTAGTRQVNGITSFYLSQEEAAPILALLDAPGKSFPWWWLDLGSEDRAAVLEEARYWDGHRGPRSRAYSYSNTDFQSVDVLQALAAITSTKTRCVLHEPRGKEVLPQKRLTVREIGHAHTRGDNLEVTSIPYTGPVACLGVDSTFVLVRDRGVTAIMGQTNFGVVFNQGAKSLAQKLGCTEDRAQSYIDALMRAYPALDRYLRGKVSEAVRDGQVTSRWGDWYLRRRVPEIGEIGEGRHVDRMKHHAESVAKNTPIQATSNLMCLQAMYWVVRWLKDNPKIQAELNLNVHDALVLYAHRSCWREVAAKVRSIMLALRTKVVRMKVDLEMSESDYGHMESVKDL